MRDREGMGERQRGEEENEQQRQRERRRDRGGREEGGAGLITSCRPDRRCLQGTAFAPRDL